MKFGICVPNYGDALSLESVSAVATEAERLGYESLWTTDHVLMSRQSGTPYEKIFDSIATLVYLAPLTKTVKLGISSLIIAMRNPVVAAKQLASIDCFAGGGRVLLAMAAGWNEQEFTNLGADFHSRGKMLDESIHLFRSLWRGDSSFQGRATKAHFEDAVFEPGPAREIPIWIGGVSPAAMKRAAELGDAWHPNVTPLVTFRTLVGQFRGVSPAAKAKDICVRIGLNTKAKESEYIGATGEKRIIFSGKMEENQKIVAELEKLGVSTAILVPSPDGKISSETQLHSIREFADKFL
ncbi:MAG TPA: TIGR03619 family F420-dependent LLM class oxidoreductase [Nitrososphaerales archaeon]|nr:TIGR03619 family F420-dependent LLM class oxidoreductase [Nitrososphaerales archaeon]